MSPVKGTWSEEDLGISGQYEADPRFIKSPSNAPMLNSTMLEMVEY